MKTKKILNLIVIIFFLSTSNISALQNSIKIKINEEIITSIDIKKEIIYLKLINRNFYNIDDEKSLEIAKNSLIKEKIKIIELNKNFKELKLDDTYIDKIIENTFLRLGFSSLEEFDKLLAQNKLSLRDIEQKISIETLWNELIFYKFSSKINIDEDKIKTELVKKNDKFNLTYQLSEILFKVDKLSNVEQKLELIKKTIKKQGFENAALTFSISGTANSGGKLGQIEFNALNNNIKNSIKNLKIGEISEPIFTPNGFLILKIEDIKKIENTNNIENELKKIIEQKKNQQLNQYSNIYFNKIKKDIKIYEF